MASVPCPCHSQLPDFAVVPCETAPARAGLKAEPVHEFDQIEHDIGLSARLRGRDPREGIPADAAGAIERPQPLQRSVCGAGRWLGRPGLPKELARYRLTSRSVTT